MIDWLHRKYTGVLYLAKKRCQIVELLVKHAQSIRREHKIFSIHRKANLKQIRIVHWCTAWFHPTTAMHVASSTKFQE